MQTADVQRPVVGVFDTDARSRSMLHQSLDSEGYSIKGYNETWQILDDVRHRGGEDVPSLLLLDKDISGPKRQEGIRLTRQIRLYSQLPIILLSDHAGSRDQVLGLDAGADDFVCKPVLPEVLMARIRSMLRRSLSTADNADQAMGHQSVTMDDVTLNIDDASLFRTGYQRVALTQREQSILMVLIGYANQAVTRAHLFKEAVGTNWDPRDRRIDLHIAHLRRKIASLTDSRTLISTVRGKGYRLDATIAYQQH